MLRSVTLYLLVLVFVLLQTNLSAFAQNTSIPVAQWAKKLADPGDKENKWYYELYPQLDKLDSGTVFTFLNQLGSNGAAKGNYFIARFNCIEVEMLYTKNIPG